MKKRILAIILAVAIVLPCTIIGAFASQAVATTSSSQATRSQVVSLNISLNTQTKVKSLGLSFEYDTTALTLTGGEWKIEGDLASFDSSNQLAAFATENEKSYDCVIFTATFTVKANAAFASARVLCKVIAENGTQVIPVISQAGSVNIICPHTTKQGVTARAASCEAKGNSAYYTCSVCNAVFLSDKTTPTTLDKVIIPATGHSFTQKNTDKKYLKSAADYTKNAVYYYSCASCGKASTTTFEYGEKLIAAFTASKTAKKAADGYIYAVGNYTASKILAQAQAGSYIEDMQGNKLDTAKAIGSGMALVLPDGSKTVLIIQGDCNSDGIISSADARLVLRRAVALEDSIPWRDTAMNINGKTLASDDARLVLRAAVSLENPVEWFAEIK